MDIIRIVFLEFDRRRTAVLLLSARIIYKREGEGEATDPTPQPLPYRGGECLRSPHAAGKAGNGYRVAHHLQEVFRNMLALWLAAEKDAVFNNIMPKWQ